MKRIVLICTALMCQTAFGQVSMNGNKLVKDGQVYKMSQYKQVFSNPEAQNHFAKARTNNTVGSVFAYTGGFLIGFGLVPALKGKKQEVRNGVVYENQPGKAWTVVGIGAGLAAVSIPFASGAKKNANKALQIENGGTATAFQPYFKIENAGNGIALSYNF